MTLRRQIAIGCRTSPNKQPVVALAADSQAAPLETDSFAWRVLHCRRILAGLRIPNRGVRQLTLERLAVPHAPAQELRPGRHRDFRHRALGQQSPELWVMPAQRMSTIIAMRANASAQPLDFANELLAAQGLEIVIDGRIGQSSSCRCAA